MPLTWSVENVKNCESVCKLAANYDDPSNGIEKGDMIWNPVTTALVWHSLNTGIGHVTDENAGEVYARIRLVEELYGASLRNNDGPCPITMEDVIAHIGMTTNVSFKDESRASYLKRHAASFLNEEKARFDRSREAVAA